MTTEITRRFVADAETARQRFFSTTRTAAFNLSLCKSEIRMLASRPWDPDRNIVDVDLNTLQKLFDKGLIEGKIDERPRLTEAGHLVRQMLVYSQHITPHDVFTRARNIFDILSHALSWITADRAGGYTMLQHRIQDIDGVPNLVIAVNEGLGGYSKWAIPLTAVQRVG